MESTLFTIELNVEYGSSFGRLCKNVQGAIAKQLKMKKKKKQAKTLTRQGSGSNKRQEQRLNTLRVFIIRFFITN